MDHAVHRDQHPRSDDRPALTAHFRPEVVVAAGLTVAALGAALMVGIVDANVPLPLLIGTFSIVGLGQGAAFTLVSDLIISAAPAEQTGSAAAAQEVGGELGTALGLATGGAVGVFVYRSSLSDSVPHEVPDSAAREAQSSVHEGVATAENLPDHGPALLDAVQQATTHGLQAYAGVGAALTAATALLVTVTIVRRGSRSAGWPPNRASGSETTRAEPGLSVLDLIQIVVKSRQILVLQIPKRRIGPGRSRVLGCGLRGNLRP